MREDVLKRDFILDTQYFVNIEVEDIQKGKIKAELTVTRRESIYEMNFHLCGTVVIPCDRCLDDMDFPIDTTARLAVKFGTDYDEESNEIVVIPESEGTINLAWFLYEFVSLAVPIKHYHSPGKCNRQMLTKLRTHTVQSSYDEQDDVSNDCGDIINENSGSSTDSRWDALKDDFICQ
ncbi:MAG: DUF177 domain-containing protein [Dysgonamonadaceae bacterium]|nr:DUF177 domain-containing protein [Dysgonamonadaceae bacterium]